jgi:outer membrane receptor protein involved in Fe transport
MVGKRSEGWAYKLRALLLSSGAGFCLLADSVFAEGTAIGAAGAPQQQGQVRASAAGTMGEAGAVPPANPAPNAVAPPAGSAAIPEQVFVTGSRTQLVGTAATSSQGEIVQEELDLTPAFRPGQLLETVPGLVVTSHSGEGKANEFLLRGFNLDHGTDLATFVDDIPINMPSHAHGNGYTDLNFLIPEVVSGVQFTKGPYFAEEGNFASVGSDHIGILDTINDQASATVGTFGFERLFTAGSRELGTGTVLGALELSHYDGPWTHGDDQRKINAVVRYSQGDASQGYSLTAMYYRDLWNATTDQPVRAMDPAYMASLGLTPIGRFSSLDPTDAGQAQQIHISGEYHTNIGAGHIDANVYEVNNRLTLWNDFSHFLVDPVFGDQEAQNENRLVAGGGVSYAISDKVLGFDNDFLVGIQNRYDNNHVGRDATKDRQFLSITELDRVQIEDLGAYAQTTTHWTGWMRTVLGVREDYITATDKGTNPGNVSATLFQPKASLIVSPWEDTEFYLSAGRGFHSDDVRGVTKAALDGVSGAPLIARSTGEEVGVRSTILPNLTATLTAFNIDFQSETTYDPDIGQDSAGPPSRRYGVELNTTYQAFAWLEFYTSIAASHARYTQPYDDGTGHLGEYIPNAPSVIANAAAYLKNLGPWSGGIEYRYLGGYPVSSGPCVNSAAVNDFPGATSCANAPTAPGLIKGKGYGELNIDAKYAFGTGWRFSLGLYNALDTHANAAEFWYVDRLPGEPAGGVAGLHIHPLEPRTVRFTLSKTFG